MGKDKNKVKVETKETRSEFAEVMYDVFSVAWKGGIILADLTKEII